MHNQALRTVITLTQIALSFVFFTVSFIIVASWFQ